jgi:type IV secretion system protein VirD4
LGRLDFFETALAFMAGYGIRAFLIAQSLNQIVKAYGENNSILDNCHVRVAFATNDERTARRISDALGTATEQRAMRNYAGHRLAPWLAHVMVSRQETSRPLLTPGEVMQLPASDALVMVSGVPPMRVRKLRYYEDRRFAQRLLAAPRLGEGGYADRPAQRPHDWVGVRAGLPVIPAEADGAFDIGEGSLQQARQPDLPLEEPRPLPAEDGDSLGLGDEEADGAAERQLMDRLSPLPPVVVAHGLNEGAGRAGDRLPSF